jgi:hypothetical protein
MSWGHELETTLRQLAAIGGYEPVLKCPRRRVIADFVEGRVADPTKRIGIFVHLQACIHCNMSWVEELALDGAYENFRSGHLPPIPDSLRDS